MFIIVPVIDLLDGQAVQARYGNRKSYKPLCTPLSRSSDPLAVAQAYLSLHPFDQIYVADLDAIRGAHPNTKIIAAMRERFSPVQIWVDGGFRNHAMLAKLSLPGIRPVIGSETLTDTGLLSATHAPILSLDYHRGRFLGPASLQTDIRSWPRDVIVMSMSRIGCDNGRTGNGCAICACAPRPHGCMPPAVYAASTICEHWLQLECTAHWSLQHCTAALSAPLCLPLSASSQCKRNLRCSFRRRRGARCSLSWPQHQPPSARRQSPA